MNKFLKFAIDVAEKTGKKLYASFREEGSLIRRQKTNQEFKTTYDQIADKIIKDSIEKHFPHHSYLTEETGLVEKEKDFLWIIDPLDGTSNFADHNPFFSISIALWHKGKPLLGVIEAPMLKERFIALAGEGAYRYDLLRKKKSRARVSKISKLEDSYFVYCEGGERDKRRMAKIYAKIYPKVREFRKLGSGALELAWVGTGRAEGHITTETNLWDIAAGILFVKEAGGKILHLDGSPCHWQEFVPLKKIDLLTTNGKVKTTFNYAQLR